MRAAMGVGLLAFGAAGCGSNNTETPDAGAYGLSDGPYCYAITSILPGTQDGCGLDVAALVGQDLPTNYASATGVLTVGSQGSLGAGVITYNTGILNRDGNTSDSSDPRCTWHQTDTTNVTVTAQNAFTVSVTEVESGFAAACASTFVGGTCTSTWSWTMAIDGTKTVAGGCQ